MQKEEQNSDTPIISHIIAMLKHRWPTLVAVILFSIAWPMDVRAVANLLIIIAFAYPIFGFFRGQFRKLGVVVIQTITLIGFIALGLVTLNVNEELGRYIAATGMLAHGAWDFYHHRTNSKVVPKPYAEFCAILDTLLAIAILLPLHSRCIILFERFAQVK